VDAGLVYRTHARAVLAYLRGQGADDPEDVLGEVFLHVARSLHRFRGNDEELRRWLFTIARNRLIDDRRHRARRPQISGQGSPDQPMSVETSPIDPELIDALRTLTPDQREVVLLRFVADLSLDDIAAVTRRSAGAVKSMQHRALAQLARILTAPGSAVPGDG
jgi:RNA polymerase sigma factor (sigma-70 family)